RLGRSPPPPICTLIPRLRMVKELAPMEENESVNEFLIASIDVRIPTNAVIPMAIISAVRNVRSLLLLIDCNESFTFSRRGIFTDMYSFRYFSFRRLPVPNVTARAGPALFAVRKQPRQ